MALFFGFTENLAHKREDAGLDHSACKQTFDHAQAGNEGTGRAKTLMKVENYAVISK